MRRLFTAVYAVMMAVLVLSLSGCGGGHSNSFISNNDVASVAEVASIESPAFQIGSSYRIIRGASISGMGGAQYYVSNTGTDSSKAALNLGFSEALGSQTLVFVDNATNRVVFAYDPLGLNGNYKTSGTVTYSGGTQLKYTSLNIPEGFFSSMNVDTGSAKTIYLNGDTATIDGTSVPVYNYVWHADPDHRDEYYTLEISGTTELTESEMLENVSAVSGVYINHDIRYLPSGLDFTALAANDDEQEYAAYYSDSVREVVSNELGGSLTGPYIFATLPMSGGMGGQPGGGDFGGGTPPDVSGDFGGGTPPDGGGTPPFAAAFTRNGDSYNSEIESTISLMTHSAEEAYLNPVLHITEPGVYTLKGTWNGQIWIEIGEDSTDKAAIILDSVDVTCTVAPALVFKEVYECGPDDEDTVAARMAADSGDIGQSVLDDAGAVVVIADDTVNNFTGANVYRMLKPQQKKSSVTTIDGTDVSQQKKRYKMDGAFYSFMSMAMGGGEKANGVLNVVSSTYEGVNTELHMTFESGILTVYAPEDGMNFNEDNVSVFTMLGGELTVTATGADGIDSNGYIAILGGSLDITAAQDSGQLNAGAEGPLDADCGVYMADGVNYSHRAYSGTGDNTPSDMPQPGEESGDNTPSDIPQPGEESGDVTPSTDSGDISTPSEDEPDVTPSPSQPADEPSSGEQEIDEPDIVTPDSGDSSSDSGDSSSDSSDNTDNETSSDISSDTTTESGDIPDVPGTEVQPQTPAQDDDSSTVTPDTPAAEETETVTITSSSGTTTINMGGTSKLKTDPDAATPRTVSTSGNVFMLERQVNTFSGLTAD